MPANTHRSQRVALSTAEEAAAILGVPDSQVYSLCRQRKMPHYRIGRYIRLNMPEVLSWASAQQEPSEEHLEPSIIRNPRRKG